MRAKIRLKVKRHEKTTKWDIGKLSKKEEQAVFFKDVTANIQSTQKKWNIYMKYGTKANKE